MSLGKDCSHREELNSTGTESDNKFQCGVVQIWVVFQGEKGEKSQGIQSSCLI